MWISPLLMRNVALTILSIYIIVTLYKPGSLHCLLPNKLLWTLFHTSKQNGESCSVKNNCSIYLYSCFFFFLQDKIIAFEFGWTFYTLWIVKKYRNEMEVCSNFGTSIIKYKEAAVGTITKTFLVIQMLFNIKWLIPTFECNYRTAQSWCIDKTVFNSIENVKTWTKNCLTEEVT